MATPVEVVDDAVLSGRTRTTNNHAIAATHQAADSNAALPRRERGAANAEAWRGDDVASACMLVATPCLALAAAASATALTRTCCVSAAPWARAARVARPAAGSGFMRRRPRRRRRAWHGCSQWQGAVFKAVLCVLWHDRLACAHCQYLFARAGLPWHADPISALPVALLPCITVPLYEVYIPVPYLWYLKGTLWHYRSYDFQAPGRPTTETYSQLYLSSHRRISTQSDAIENSS